LVGFVSLRLLFIFQSFNLSIFPEMASITLTQTLEAIELETLSRTKSQTTAERARRGSLTHAASAVPSVLSDNDVLPDCPPTRSNLQIVFTIFMPSFVGFLASFTNGLITVCLPDIARSLALDRALYLWPSSVYGLTSGASLLIAGSVADIVGARPVELVGIVMMGVFALACGFASTGEQLVVFRALQGVGLAMHLPSSVALISGAVPSGRTRNFGFACLGFSQPLGFGVGLVVSGILVQRAGWRCGFYLSGGATLLVAIIAVWTIPKLHNPENQSGVVQLCKNMGRNIDWVGVFTSSGGLALLAYALAMLSADLTTIRSTETATVLAISIVLLAMFPVWMHYRERNGKPALVPNKLWRNGAFTSTCIMIALSWGAINSIELFSSL
jgi:MFS family permease